MKNKRSPSPYFALLCAIAVPVFAQSAAAPITLQQAVSMARAQNPSLIAAREDVSTVKAGEITAGLRQNPVFTLSGADVSLSATNPASPYSYSANFSRLFERGQKRRWRLGVADASTAVTQSQYEDAQRQLVFQVRDAFAAMLTAMAALKITEGNLTGYRQTVNLSRIRLKDGQISQTDFMRIDLQQAEFESDVSKARLGLTQARDQLQSLIGIEHPSANFHIKGSLTPPTLNLSLPQMEKNALAARPDYRAALQTEQLAAANVKLANANGTTDPTLGAEYERAGTYNSVGFQISAPVRIFDRNQGAKEAARFEVRSSQFAADAARNQVVNDVQQAWAAYQTALVQDRRFHGHYLSEATTVLNNLQYSYRQGGASLLDYLDALRDFRQINLDAINADQQVWFSLNQLSFATATEILP